jgi:hypothetical protein
VIAWAVPIVAMVLAVRACRRGSVSLGRTVIWLSGVVLFIVSISTIGGTIESAVTGSPPTAEDKVADDFGGLALQNCEASESWSIVTATDEPERCPASVVVVASG